MSNQSTGEWFYAQGTEQRGPVDLPTLRQMLASGALSSNDLVWRDGMGNWQPAGTVPELQGASPAAGGAYAAPTGGGYASPSPQPAPGYGMPVGGSPYGGATLDPQLQQLQSKASTAMTLGIVSLVLSLCVCGPAGIGLGIWAWNLGSKIPPGYPFSGQGKTGFVCGIIGTILGGISTVFSIIYVIVVIGSAR